MAKSPPKNIVDSPPGLREKAVGFLARVPRLPNRPAILFVELFVAIALSVNFYYLVKTQCLAKKRTGNTLSIQTFCWLSPYMNVSGKDLLPAWRTRVAAPALSALLTETRFDYPVDFRSGKCRNLRDVSQSEDFQQLFGLYHAGWVFLTFLTLIVFRRDALLIMFGVFAGLMYNLIEPSGMYYYPWDMPTLFFFTLACLLFDRGWFWPLLPVVCLGGLVKETTLCCALFILLGGKWNWPKGITGFLAVVAGTFFFNRLLLAHFDVQTRMLSMNNARSVGDLFQHTLLKQNLPVLFSLHLNHVAFTNAGVLLLMMLIPWRNRRDVIFKLVILVFALGQFLYGYIDEFRVWYELLPLGWMLVSEAVARQREAYRAGPMAAFPETDRRWQATYWLTMGTLFAVTLAGSLVARLTAPPPPPETRSQEEILQGKIASAQGGNVDAQYDLGRTYENNQNFDEAIRWYLAAANAGNAGAQYALAMVYTGVKHDYPTAATWFRKAAAQGHTQAEYCLGVICWNGLDGHQDYKEGSKWIFEAAVHGEPHAQLDLGQIYEHPPEGLNPPNYVEAYKWLKLAGMAGIDEAVRELKICSATMTPEQIAEAEAWVKRVREKHSK